MALEPIAAQATDKIEQLGGFSLCIHMPSRGLTYLSGFNLKGNGFVQVPDSTESYWLSGGTTTSNGGFSVCIGSSLTEKVGLDDIVNGNSLKYLKIRETFSASGGLLFDQSGGDGFNEGFWMNVNGTISGGMYRNNAGTTASLWFKSQRFPVELMKDDYLTALVQTGSTVAAFQAGLLLEAGALDLSSGDFGLNVRITGTALEIRDNATVRATVAFTPSTTTGYNLVAQRLGTAIIAEVYTAAGALITSTSYTLSAPEITLYDGDRYWGAFLAGTVSQAFDHILWYPLQNPAGPRPLFSTQVKVGEAETKVWFRQLLTTYAATVPTLPTGFTSEGLTVAVSLEDSPTSTADTEELVGVATGYTQSFPAVLDWAAAVGIAQELTGRVRFGLRGRKLCITVHQGYPINKDTRIYSMDVRFKPMRGGRP